MSLPRRQFLHLAVGAVALPAVSHIARAQTYPTRPVRIIVGYPAGGVLDIYARLMGLSQRCVRRVGLELGAGTHRRLSVNRARGNHQRARRSSLRVQSVLLV